MRQLSLVKIKSDALACRPRHFKTVQMGREKIGRKACGNIVALQPGRTNDDRRGQV